MANIEKIKDDVRNLPNYGVHIRGFPPEISKPLNKMIWKNLRSHFSFRASGMVLYKSWRWGKKGLKEYPDATQMLNDYGKQASKEFPLFLGMFLVLADKLGNRRQAYDKVIKPLMQDLAVISMPVLYEVDKLEKMEDPFEAFKQYNVGLLGDDPLYPIDEFVDNGDHFRFRVQSCIQYNLATAFGADELGESGCDHDCFSYPLIEDRVNAVFRRPQTLAKGGTCCDFNFYRKGTEPKGPYENK